MKLIIFLLLFPCFAVASKCNVYGISDGPQNLSCIIQVGERKKEILLECESSRYKLIWNNRSYTVDSAYHEEVESGSNPLVFRSGKIIFTAIIHRYSAQAELEVSGHLYKGICRL
jgi:hypothetical protein